jgi:hypothetical protein
MSVYVDTLHEWGWRMYGRTIASCHMIADTPAELHEMALQLGLKMRHQQTSGLGDLHYDLTPTRRAKAIALGAVELTQRAFVEKMRALRGAPTLPKPKPGLFSG